LPEAARAQGTSGIARCGEGLVRWRAPRRHGGSNQSGPDRKGPHGVTDDQGQYKIVDLLPGTYTVTFTMTGFSTVKRPGIDLTSNFTAAINADLRVGQLEETVTVSGQSPVVDVQNVVQQKIVTREVLFALPINKELGGYASITPGAIIAANQQDVGGNKDPISHVHHDPREQDDRLAGAAGRHAIQRRG